MGRIGNVNENRYFFLDEAPMYKEKYILRMNHDKFLFPCGTKGSYGVFPARLLGLTYPDYLRFLRDVLGADVIGKNSKYPVAFFDKNETTRQFVKLLNAKMETIYYNRKHPYRIIEKEDGTLEKVSFENQEGK